LSEREYVDTAKKFVSDPPSTAEVFVRESGEVMIYDPPTKTFAVRTPEGVPATMYKADMAHWERQLAEYGGRRVGR
jgi:pyocin large subunit-like protein